MLTSSSRHSSSDDGEGRWVCSSRPRSRRRHSRCHCQHTSPRSVSVMLAFLKLRQLRPAVPSSTAVSCNSPGGKQWTHVLAVLTVRSPTAHTAKTLSKRRCLFLAVWTVATGTSHSRFRKVHAKIITDTVSSLSGNAPELVVFIWTQTYVQVVQLNLNVLQHFSLNYLWYFAWTIPVLTLLCTGLTLNK